MAEYLRSYHEIGYLILGPYTSFLFSRLVRIAIVEEEENRRIDHLE